MVRSAMVGLLILVGSPTARAGDACAHGSWQEYTARLPADATVRAVEDADLLKAFIVAFNETPPESHIHPARVMRTHRRDGGVDMVAFLDADGCFIGIMNIRVVGGDEL